MKSSLWVMVLTAVVALSFSMGSAASLLDVQSAYAKDSKSKSDSSSKKDRKSEESKSSSEKKELVCHAPPGNPDDRQTLSVAESAVGAHLAHGDSMGECPPDCVCPPSVSSCTCPDGNPGVPGAALLPATQRELHGN